jgi:hypothetical protein
MSAMTLLNELGDLTIVWEPQNDAEMESLIQRRMDAGITFFLIEPRMGGIVAPDRKRLKKPADARKHRALSIPDDEVAKFVADGKAEVVPTPAAPVRKSRVSRSAKEVAAGESIGIRQRSGG